MKYFPPAFIFALGAVCSITTVVQAQDMYPNLAPSTLDAYMSSHIDVLSLKSTREKNATSTSKSHKSSQGSMALSNASTSTTYTPSSIVAAQVRDKAIKRVRAISSADAAKMAAALQKNNAATLWQRATSGYGLRSNDIADAMAAYWVINYMAVKDIQNAPTASVQGARNQFKRLLLTIPIFSQQSNAEKQRMSEELYFKFLAQQSALQQANKRGDSKAKARLRSSARAQFRDQMGIDLQEFSLTSAGFR